MNKLMSWLENSFAPKMNKINHNTWIVVLKDSINQIMPLIFLGSIFSMLTLPRSVFGWEWWPNFGVPQGWTMGMVSIMIAFLLPFNLMEKSKLRRSRTVAGIAGIIIFAIAITPQLVEAEAVGFSHASFGAGGMFIAIVTGVITGVIIRAFGKFSFFKEDSAIPDFVRAWFDQMLPIAAIEENIATGAANVFTASFKYGYLTIGGVGCTLALAIFLLRSKSKKLSALGKAVIVPSIFNINEPVVFGAIAWNPILMLPMILCSFSACTIS